MFIYGTDYRYHFNKFDKQLITELYKRVCISTNSEDYDQYDPDLDVLGEYYFQKLVGMYYRSVDRIYINVLIAYRRPSQGFYNIYVFHKNLKPIEQMYYNRNQPRRHSVEYYMKLKNMKVKLGMIQVSNFKGLRSMNYEIL